MIKPVEIVAVFLADGPLEPKDRIHAIFTEIGIAVAELDPRVRMTAKHVVGGVELHVILDRPSVLPTSAE